MITRQIYLPFCPLLQIASAAEPTLQSFWEAANNTIDKLAGGGKKAAAAAFQAKVERWWMARVPELGNKPAAASLQFEVGSPCPLLTCC